MNLYKHISNFSVIESSVYVAVSDMQFHHAVLVPNALRFDVNSAPSLYPNTFCQTEKRSIPVNEQCENVIRD